VICMLIEIVKNLRVGHHHCMSADFSSLKIVRL
jgi:hypothetical protein